ncbi:pentapeptide repeat-containing protein [Halostella pelagica]|uniref:pentapeptide repeat-containing protein n=1 Tax=Halostella pelagica TaxID=2583824 RepID=UPI00107FE843|nr:pentapeptide repeat-containing protein [Halostella pelagica]
MTQRTLDESRTILELSPEEREQRDVTAAEVRDAFLEIIERGDQQAKVFEGCTFPELVLDYQEIESATKRPVVFRDCAFPGGIRAAHADFRVPIHFEDCTVTGFELERARFEYDLAIHATEIRGEVNGFEARFDSDMDCTGVTFSEPVSMDEATFSDDTSFDDATFEQTASFRAATFAGISNELNDNASFERASFEATANFQQATFGFTSFEGVAFGGLVSFEEAQFDGNATFADSTFTGEVDFDEVRFVEDVSFSDCVFEQNAVFRGTMFEGGARTLKDDARFADATFHEDVNFRAAEFRSVNFERAVFGKRALFEEVRFDADADFIGATFTGEADFDEARFDGDADFSTASFERQAVFRGATFEGETQHLEQNAVFDEVHFATDVDFDNVTFTSVGFCGTEFGGVIDFTGAEFTDEFEFMAEAVDDDNYVNFTDAVLKEGVITQPADHWVRYDFTQASLGDITLKAERKGGHREILDYFRFCNTEFNEFDGYEFDFSAHTYYLDRNDWNLHAFDEAAGSDYEYALEMTPENIETTYLKAKKAASAGGYVKAAGEFRVQRQRYARRKHIAIVRDKAAGTRARLSNASRAVENYFLDVSCGYGMRLGRILAVFLVTPLIPAVLYAFGGQPFRTDAGQLSSIWEVTTPAGQAILFKNLHFSYITFLTIGYGNIGPKGALARVFAGLEVYLSVILGGLVLYALIKRSEL